MPLRSFVSTVPPHPPRRFHSVEGGTPVLPPSSAHSLHFPPHSWDQEILSSSCLLHQTPSFRQTANSLHYVILLTVLTRSHSIYKVHLLVEELEAPRHVGSLSGHCLVLYYD